MPKPKGFDIARFLYIAVVLLLYIVNKINWEFHFERNETAPVRSTAILVTDNINDVSEFVMPLLTVCRAKVQIAGVRPVHGLCHRLTS
jgi:hypothetical protein